MRLPPTARRRGRPGRHDRRGGRRHPRLHLRGRAPAGRVLARRALHRRPRPAVRRLGGGQFRYSLPGDGVTLPAGPTEITGYALAGDDRRVPRVDMSVDGGRRWRQAELGEEAGPWAWRQWRLTAELRPGETEILARAWDSAAALQPESPAQLWNPKRYANNSWARVRVTVRA
ncbi:MAG: hypothetical protein ACLPUO_19600 [Streptosporangiaceae bacterium]